MKIHLFHHAVDLPNSETVFSEQLDRIINSGILQDQSTYHICINGNLNSFEDHFNRIAKYSNIKIIHVADNYKYWEYPTLTYLKNFVDNSKDCEYVAYIHMKGSSNPTFQNTKDWRRLMEFFIIDNYKKSINYLGNGYNIAGVNWHNGGINCHFSGNFWWARADYIRTLNHIPNPTKIIQGTRSPITNNFYNSQNWIFDCEAWIGSGQFRQKEIFNSGTHHYRDPYPEHFYINHKFD